LDNHSLNGHDKTMLLRSLTEVTQPLSCESHLIMTSQSGNNPYKYY